MISLANLISSHAMSYFQEKSDYFLNKEGKGMWSGQGAARLNLEGHITQTDFERVLSGKHPDDGSLLRQKNGEVVRACTDITFSAPKSLSLIAQFGSEQQQQMVHSAWDSAVKHMIRYIEENNSHIREQDNGSRIISQTDNIIAARFDHALSRNLDPQLHSHVLVMNMSKSMNGQWKALHNDSIYTDKASLTKIFHAQLASNMKNHGFGIDITDREKAEFEIKGVSPELIDKFSSRRKEVVAKVAELEKDMPYLSGAKLHEAAALATRREKAPVSEGQLENHFQNIFNQVGMSEKDLIKSVEQHRSISSQDDDQRSVSQTMLSACAVCTEHESVFLKTDIIAQAAKMAHSQFSLKQYENKFDDLQKQGAVVPLGGLNGQTVFTTSEMQTIEHLIIGMINRSAGQHHSQITDQAIIETIRNFEDKNAFSLTCDQKKMIRLLNNSDRVSIVQGDAGTGKTSSMQVIHDICQKNNITCAGIAPTGRAVREMKNAGIKNSMTIAAFVNKSDLPDFELPDVLITDEISMAGSRDIYKILSATENTETKLVFTGDKKQLPSISAGRVHGIIQKKTRVRKVEMKQLLRQKHGSNAQKVMAAFTRAEKIKNSSPVTEALQEIKNQGNIHKIKQVKSRIKSLTDYTVQKICNGDNIAVLCNTIVSREKINKSVRSALISTGYLKQDNDIIQASVSTPVSLSAFKQTSAGNYKKADKIIFTKPAPGFKQWSEHTIMGISQNKNEIRLYAGKNKPFKSVSVEKYGHCMQALKHKSLSLQKRDRIVFLKNSQDLNVKNGTTGSVSAIKENGTVSVITDDKNTISFNTKDKTAENFYNHFDHGYALTVHKSQGGTYDEAVVFNSSREKTTANAAYVAITRAKENVKIFTDDYDKLKQQTKNFYNKMTSQDNFEQKSVPLNLPGMVAQ